MQRLFIFVLLAVAVFACPRPVAAQLLEEVYACPKDIRMCPDGTGVGRSGPDCAFVPCGGDHGQPGFVEGSPGQSGSAKPEPMPEPPVSPEIMCTMDAKLCPDGSAVGRTGPNCTFAPCPGEDESIPEEDPLDDTEDEETDPY